MHLCVAYLFRLELLLPSRMQFSSKVVPAGFDLLACKDLSDSNELMDLIYEFVLRITTPGGAPYHPYM